MAKWSDVRPVDLALPEAEESTSHLERALKVAVEDSWLIAAPKRLANTRATD